MEPSEYQNIFENEETHWWYRGMRMTSLLLLERYLPQKRGLKVLDTGCGTGGMTTALQKYGAVYGVDNSPLAISFCRRRGLRKVRVGSVNQLPCQGNFFDLVTSFDVLYITGVDPVKALKECYRVLKPGGLLLMRVPAFSFLAGQHDKIVHTARRFTRQELVTLLQKSDFLPLFISYANFFLFPVILIQRLFIRGSKPQSDVRPVVKLANKLLESILELESRLMRVFLLPWGVSLFAVAKKR